MYCIFRVTEFQQFLQLNKKTITSSQQRQDAKTWFERIRREEYEIILELL